MSIFVLLQNAWRDRGGDSWLYNPWVWALRRSRTGRRLVRALGRRWNRIYFCNTTPRVSTHPSIRLPPDLQYVERELRRVEVDVVLACGKQAEVVARKLWSGPLLCIPHPASRVLTNALLDKTYDLLYGWPPVERLALRQQRGQVVEEQL